MQKVHLVQYLDVRYKVQIQHVLTRGRLFTHQDAGCTVLTMMQGCLVFTHQDAGCTVLTMMQGCLLSKMQAVQYSP